MVELVHLLNIFLLLAVPRQLRLGAEAENLSLLAEVLGGEPVFCLKKNNQVADAQHKADNGSLPFRGIIISEADGMGIGKLSVS